MRTLVGLTWAVIIAQSPQRALAQQAGAADVEASPNPPCVHEYIANGAAIGKGRSRTIKVAGIMNPPVRKGDYKEKNFEQAASLIRQAADAGAELVCTYEQFLDGYGFDANKITDLKDKRVDRYEVIGESRYLTRLGALARELKIAIVAGVGINANDATYNSALIFDSSGEIVGQYRKTHNQNRYARWFAPLNAEEKKEACPSYDVGPGRISIKICNDRHFRETTEYMMQNGGELILAPSFGNYDPSQLLRDTKDFGVWAVFVHPKGCQFMYDGKVVHEQRSVEGEASVALYEVAFQSSRSSDRSLVHEAKVAMRKAARHYRENFAVDGGYPRNRPPDSESDPAKKSFTKLAGASPIGLSYLYAYLATNDSDYLNVPKEASHALAKAQLATGGWHHKMNSDPKRAATFHYRRDVETGDTDKGDRTIDTVFDDDVSQSAARLLMLYDRATRFQDAEVHHAARYALSGFINLQYDSGGWPMWARQSRPAPATKARFPESWSREYPREFYPPYYTINDGAIPKVIDALLLGHEVYGEQAYLTSARRGGDFLLLAQMPEPQPAWCQQYTMEMTPAWARKFEPPAIVSLESVDVIETLMKLYVATGDDKYRVPIGPALEWFDRSRLPSGEFARFYELRTNRPLYFTKAYKMVYTDEELPTHYRLKVNIDVDRLRCRYETLEQARQRYLDVERGDDDRLTQMLDWPNPQVGSEDVRNVIAAMDEHGQWQHDGRSPGRVFTANLNQLSSYVKVKACTARQEER